MEENNKSLAICILKILNEYSDKNDLLTQQGIIDKLNQKYDMSCEGKDIDNQIITFYSKIKKYIAANMKNYDDNVEDFELEINKNILDKVIDTFGENVLIQEDNKKSKNEKCLLKLKSNFSKLLGFILLYKEDVEIVSPQEIRNKMMSIGDFLKNQYYKTDKDKFFSKINNYLKYQKTKWYDDAFYGSDHYFKELSFCDMDLREFEEYKICNDANSVIFETNCLDDFSFLKRFSCLRSLVVSHTEEDDFSYLKNLKLLRRIVLNGTDVKNLNFIRELNNLELLQLYNNRNLEDIEALYDNLNIKYLFVDKDFINRIDVERLKITNPKINIEVITDINKYKDINLYIEVNVFAKINEEEMPYEYLTLIFGQRFTNMDMSKRHVMIRLINRKYEEFVKELNVIKENLSEKKKEIFEDVFFNSLSIKDICNKMDLNYDAFMSLYYDLLKQLKNPKLSCKMREFLLEDNFIADMENEDFISIMKLNLDEVDLKWIFKSENKAAEEGKDRLIKYIEMYNNYIQDEDLKFVEVDGIFKPKISITYIQKKFFIGYPRAATIFDYMLKQGVVEKVLHKGKLFNLINLPEEEIDEYLASILEKIK